MNKDFTFYQLPRDIAANVGVGFAKITILEKRHELILKWLKRQVVTNRALIKPMPHPLDFMLSTDEERQSEIYAVESANRIHSAAADTYETVLEAIENGDKALAEAQFKKENPCNEYAI